jgi:hypothetical protein
MVKDMPKFFANEGMTGIIHHSKNIGRLTGWMNQSVRHMETISERRLNNERNGT